MAGRSLETLRARYNSHASRTAAGKGPVGGGPGPNARGMGGKPKDAKKTIGRIFAYLGGYKKRLALVLVCLLAHTAAQLAASYMLRPVINHIAETGIPAAERVSYLIGMLILLLALYLIGVGSAYLQNRLMLTVTQFWRISSRMWLIRSPLPSSINGRLCGT